MLPPSATQLIVKDLAATRGTRVIFQGVNVAAKAGDAVTLVGPNGAGKTTFLRCLAGLLTPFHGTVRIEGGNDEQSVGEQCHYIGHLNGIKPAFSVVDNLAFFVDFLGGRDSRETSDRVAERLALRELADVPAAYLSAGQKRRLGLARLLCAPRPLWLLDEPAVSLDRASQEILARMVAEHLTGGGIVVAATHMPLGWSDAKTIDFGEMARNLADAS